MIPVTRVEKIRTWLREHHGRCVCDECIAKASGELISRSVARAASRMCVHDPEFARFHGRCDTCGTNRMVTVSHGARWM